MKRIDGIAAKCVTFDNINSSWLEMQKNGGNRSPEIAEYGLHVETNVQKQSERLRSGTWTPGPYFSFPVNDPKPRIVDAPSVDARLVQKSLLAPIKQQLFDKMCPSSYAGIPGRGPLKACWKVRDFINSYPPDIPLFFLHYDFQHCYQSVDHDVFLSHLNSFVKDRWWMDTLEVIVDSYVNRESGKGVPLGAETSKDGVNLLLTELDRMLYYGWHQNAVRYTDDGIVVSDSKEDLESIMSFVNWYAEERLHMHLHPAKTMIGDARKGIDFCGYIIFAEGLRPRKRNVCHALHRIKKLRKDVDAGIEKEQTLRSSLTSFLGYMKYARWSVWAQQVLDASGLWDREQLKQKIIKPKTVRDQLAWQYRERKRQNNAYCFLKK